MNVVREVNKAKKGNRKSFERLVQEYKVVMYRVSKTIVGTDEDCADATQEAILKAFYSIDTLREPKYFKTWLLRIVMNECYAILRKRNNVIDFDSIDQHLLIEEKGFEALEVEDLLQQLDPHDSKVLHLYFIEDLTLKDMAYLLDLPENTVKTQIRRAKQRANQIFTTTEEGQAWKNGKNTSQGK